MQERKVKILSHPQKNFQDTSENISPKVPGASLNWALVILQLLFILRILMREWQHHQRDNHQTVLASSNQSKAKSYHCYLLYRLKSTHSLSLLAKLSWLLKSSSLNLDYTNNLCRLCLNHLPTSSSYNWNDSTNRALFCINSTAIPSFSPEEDRSRTLRQREVQRLANARTDGKGRGLRNTVQGQVPGTTSAPEPLNQS